MRDLLRQLEQRAELEREKFRAGKMDQDEKFWFVFSSLLRSRSSEDVDDWARVMADYASTHQDRDAWKFVFAVFDWFLQENKPPPWPILRAINEAFCRFRSGLTLDDAFLGKRGRGAPKKSITEREWARTNASLVASFYADEKKRRTKEDRKRGDESALEAAVDRTRKFRMAPNGKPGRGNSCAQIKRDYLQYKRK